MAEGTCSIDGCEKPQHARGWCSVHYARWRSKGDPLAPLARTRNVGPCSVDGCDQPMRKRTWCASHYAQWTRTGEEPKPFLYKWAEANGACQVCGKPVPPKSRRRKHCSGNCQMLASRARRDYPDAILPSKPCIRCGCLIDLMAEGRSHSNRAKPSTRKRRADSQLCADCARQRGYRHKWSAEALATRDGTDCGICGQPVDMASRWPDQMCPSVDHVISRADGGTDDPSNLQLAHLRCNHRKSKRSHWTADMN